VRRPSLSVHGDADTEVVGGVAPAVLGGDLAFTALAAEPESTRVRARVDVSGRA
jgi:hypothetical protein